MKAAELGYAAAWRGLRHVPAPVAAAVFRAGADLATRRGATGVLRANLRRVRPDASGAELDRLVKAGMRSYARYWNEAFRLPALDPVRVHAGMAPHTTGVDSAMEAMLEGRGVVFALPHAGNWDAAGVYIIEEMRRRGLTPEMTTVAQRLQPESLYRRFVGYRESLGFEIVAQDDGRRAHLALTRRLRAGGMVCLVADRDLTGTGIEAPFFGETVRFPAGPATLAALTGAQLHAIGPFFTPGGWGATISAPIPVPDRAGVPKATVELARHFEEHISRYPQDWHMLQELTR
ncbi:phosphatidylinositol mannoside acyltransferase [Pseudonocardia ailaonensis]|uniref:Phosphatidylinositol mannoside acyltransferase n=1 Tax=Pseudonocardia ailaonensis TaxID=367279 RepID=A0ABN2MPY3_9PSEU